MAEKKERRVFEVIEPSDANFAGDPMITKIWVDKTRDLKVALPYPVPADDEQAKEMYGPNASMRALAKKGLQILSHGPAYQDLWADGVAEGLSDEDNANRLYHLSVEVVECDPPRAASTKEPSKAMESKVKAKWAKEMGISPDELDAILANAKK